MNSDDLEILLYITDVIIYGTIGGTLQVSRYTGEDIDYKTQ